MLQFFADTIDQLDLALDQLAVNDRNFDRFALMLIDNVVELTLHQFVVDKEQENKLWLRLDKPKYDPKAIQKAIGRHFDAKVRFARKYKLIDEEMSASLLYLHNFRNTAYHQGERHEGILHSLSIFYFCCTCKLLQGYEPSFFGWSSKDIYSHRARKYLGRIKFVGVKREKLQQAFKRLECVADEMAYDLNDDLATDMAATINRTDYDIKFLANDGPQKMTRKQVIIDCQAWQFAFTDEGRAFVQKRRGDTKTIQSYVDWIANNYDWPIKTDPIRGWKSRLNKLKNTSNQHAALKSYCDFINQTESIRNCIYRAAVQLDAHIQEQIDIARGK